MNVTAHSVKGKGGGTAKGLILYNMVDVEPDKEWTEDAVCANVWIPGQIVEFRLRIADRGSGHPCRWVGSVTAPIALCFAPPVQR